MTRYKFTVEATDAVGRVGYSNQAIEVFRGLPPNTYAGLTFWVNALKSPKWGIVVSGARSGYLAANETSFDSMDSLSPTTRTLYADIGNYAAGMRYMEEEIGSADAILHRANSPAEGVHPTLSINAITSGSVGAAVNCSSLVTTAIKLLIIGIRVDNARTTDGPFAWNNTIIFQEAASYFGLSCWESGANIVYTAFNSTASVNARVDLVVPKGEACVITVQHKSGVLKIRKNGGAWNTVTSGTTASLANPVQVMNYGGPTDEGNMAWTSFCTYNATRTDAEVYEVEKYFASELDLTI